MKRVSAAAILIVLLVSVVVLAGCGEKKVPAGAIAAVGESGVVTQEQYDAIIKQAEAQYAAQEDAPAFPEEGSAEYSQLRANIVDYLVQNELIKQKAAEMDIEVTDEELDARMKEVTEQVGGKKKLAALLKEQSVSEEELRAQVEAQMLQDKVRAKVGEGVEVSEAEMKAYYDDPANKEQFAAAPTVDSRHVLVKTKAEAEEVQALLVADPSDGNWDKVAKQYSIDPGSKNEGGALGSRPEGSFVPEFEEVAFSIKVLEISDPVKTQFGFHIIQVLERTKGSTTSYEDAKPMIEQQLKFQGEEEAWNKWLEEAKEEAEIVYAPGYDPAELRAASSPSPEESPSPSPASEE